ncbi:MAG TPA: hypothetical protein VIH58_05945 [Chthoniobacterales bacterium]
MHSLFSSSVSGATWSEGTGALESISGKNPEVADFFQLPEKTGEVEKLVGETPEQLQTFRDAAEVDNRLDAITPRNCRAAVLSHTTSEELLRGWYAIGHMARQL